MLACARVLPAQAAWPGATERRGCSWSGEGLRFDSVRGLPVQVCFSNVKPSILPSKSAIRVALVVLAQLPEDEHDTQAAGTFIQPGDPGIQWT